MKNRSANIAENLLKIQAVKLQPGQPFTWASGLKSPIYCDNRSALSYPEVRSMINAAFCELIKTQYPEAEGIAGVATAGIPWGAMIADTLSLPFAYVRSKPKGHGLENCIEGRISDSQKIVMIEDLISTGGSALKAVKEVQGAGAEVLSVLSVFSYEFNSASQAFEKAGIPYSSLTGYKQLLEAAVKGQYISDSDISSLLDWRKNPEEWGKEVINE